MRATRRSACRPLSFHTGIDVELHAGSEAESLRDVDPSAAVVRIHAGLTKVARRVEDRGLDLRRTVMSQLGDEQRSQTGNVWTRLAGADLAGDCSAARAGKADGPV